MLFSLIIVSPCIRWPSDIFSDLFIVFFSFLSFKLYSNMRQTQQRMLLTIWMWMKSKLECDSMCTNSKKYSAFENRFFLKKNGSRFSILTFQMKNTFHNTVQYQNEFTGQCAKQKIEKVNVRIPNKTFHTYKILVLISTSLDSSDFNDLNTQSL